jgi:murein DD-endopeptidase MepM/ murein hydrolase activator NlpD
MRARTALVALSVTALVLGLVGAAQASDERQRKDQLDRGIVQLRGDMYETSKELRRAGAALNRAERKLPGARAKVARVRGRLAAAEARDRMLADRLRLARAEVARAKEEIAGTRADIESTNDLIGRIARSSYQQGNYAELAVVLDSQTPDDFATRVALVHNTMESQGAVLGDLAEQRADLAAQKATLVAKRAQIAEMKAAQERLVAEIRDLEQQAVAAQRAVESLIAERARALAVVQREKEAEEKRYAQMQAESQRLQRILAERARQARIAAARRAKAAAERRARERDRASRSSRSSGSSGSSNHPSGGGGGGSSNAGGPLSYPVNAYITSPYGMRTHPVTGVYKLHDGTDFGVGCGTPVRAAASGRVVQAALVTGYGNQLVIDHGAMRGAGVATAYNHLLRFAVRAGQRVSRGQVVAYSGGGEGMYGAGYSTGCHLHLTVYVNGATTDPMGWL